MKILIIEDDENKLKQISTFIKEFSKYIELTESRSYHSGIKEVLKNTFDLIILDMTMPTFDISPSEVGGRPRVYAGIDILSQMKKKLISIPVVVVTQFETFGESGNKISLDELDNQLRSEYNNYLSAIYYNASSDNWKNELTQFLNFKNSKS